jgi:hypothetical protein
MTYFEVVSKYFPGGTEKSHDILTAIICIGYLSKMKQVWYLLHSVINSVLVLIVCLVYSHSESQLLISLVDF